MIKWNQVNKEKLFFSDVTKVHIFLLLSLSLVLVFGLDVEADENDVGSNIEIEDEWYNDEQDFVWEINGTYNGILYIYYVFEYEDNPAAEWKLYENITIANESAPNDNVTKGIFSFDFPEGSGFYKIESNFSMDDGMSELGEGFDNFTGDALKFDNTNPVITVNSFILELKSEEDSSISWDGTGNIYDSTSWNKNGDIDSTLLKNLTLDYTITDEHSGIRVSQIQYSEDNFTTWEDYSESDVIKLDFSTIYIRIGVMDLAGNYVEYKEDPIDIENLPINDGGPAEDDSKVIVEEDESNNNLIFVVLIIVGIAFAFYKHEQGKAVNRGKNVLSSERTECPNCSVLVPRGSTSCTFCGEVWGKNNNTIFANPFSEATNEKQEEVIPRTGEILIGSDIDRWKIEVGARSCVGGRKNNEDSISWNTFLKITDDIPHSIKLGIVADGVGGHNRGEIASSMLISTFNKVVSEDVNNPFHTELFSTKEHKEILEKAYHNANKTIFEKAQDQDYNGMATTAVSIYIWEDSKGNNGFLIGNVGDSRGYLINKKEIRQITKDDSEVQKLIDQGKISEEEAKNHPHKNVITQAIGNKEKITPRIEAYDLQKCEFDYVLLCSDGVSDKMNEKELHKIIIQFENPQDACDRIVKIINRTNSNHDNNSLILIKFPNLFKGEV